MILDSSYYLPRIPLNFAVAAWSSIEPKDSLSLSSTTYIAYVVTFMLKKFDFHSKEQEKNTFKKIAKNVATTNICC